MRLAIVGAGPSDGRLVRIHLQKHAAEPVIVYGQTEITRDLNSLNLADGIEENYVGLPIRDPVTGNELA